MPATKFAVQNNIREFEFSILLLILAFVSFNRWWLSPFGGGGRSGGGGMTLGMVTTMRTMNPFLVISKIIIKARWRFLKIDFSELRMYSDIFRWCDYCLICKSWNLRSGGAVTIGKDK